MLIYEQLWFFFQALYDASPALEQILQENTNLNNSQSSISHISENGTQVTNI